MTVLDYLQLQELEPLPICMTAHPHHDFGTS